MNYVATTFAPLYFIGSSSFLQVTSTTIKSRMVRHSVRHWTTELVALECLKKSLHTYNATNVVTALVSSFLRWIFFILAGKMDNHKSLDEF